MRRWNLIPANDYRKIAYFVTLLSRDTILLLQPQCDLRRYNPNARIVCNRELKF